MGEDPTSSASASCCSPPLHWHFLLVPCSLILRHPTPASRTTYLWDAFACLHSKQVSKTCLCLISLCLKGKEAASWPSCPKARWPLAELQPARVQHQPRRVSAQWGLCGCLSLQGAAWPFPLCAAARAGLKGVRFALSPLCFLQTFWWLVEQREKEPLLRTGSAEVPGLYRSGRRMFLLHTQSGLALLGLNVELLS